MNESQLLQAFVSQLSPQEQQQFVAIMQKPDRNEDDNLLLDHFGASLEAFLSEKEEELNVLESNLKRDLTFDEQDLKQMANDSTLLGKFLSTSLLAQAATKKQDQDEQHIASIKTSLGL